MSVDAPPRKADTGAPAWVMTFADLMSLLMCFFVLLLSFSEMDVAKYKQLAGSLKFAFGVQREIKAKEPPKGINVIAQEFSPGRPEPTPFNVIRQMTTADTNINLDLGKERRRPVPTPKAEQIPDREKTFKPQDRASRQADREAGQKAGQKADSKAGERSGQRAQLMPGKKKGQADGLTEAQKRELARAKKLAEIRLDQKLKAEQQLAGLKPEQAVPVDKQSLAELLKAREKAERLKKLEHSVKLISNALGREIKAGSVDVELEGQKIIIRVREKASFDSGRAELKSAFRPLLARVAKILQNAEGKIVVAGHTDNVPIYTERFRSNWELSSARAVSVVHEMMLATDIPADRFLIEGYADTRPVAPNDTPANRAKNRRVEIILMQGEDKEAGDGEITAGPAQPAAKKAAVKRPAPVARSTRPAGTAATPVGKPAPVSAGIKAGGGESAPGTKQQTRPAAKPLGIKAAGSH